MEDRNRFKQEYNDSDYIDIWGMVQYILKRSFYIIIATAIAGIGTFFYTVNYVTPQYSSDIMIYVNNQGTSIVNEVAAKLTGSDLSASQALVKTYSTILKNRETLEMVIDEAELDCTYSALSRMIDVTAVTETAIMQVKVTTVDPLLSTKIANAILKVLPVRVSQIIDGSSVARISGAIPNVIAVSPDIVKSTFRGAAVGFVISVGILVLLFLMDVQIRSEKYLQQAYPDIPLLTVVPNLDVLDKGSYGYGYNKKNAYSQKKSGRREDS